MSSAKIAQNDHWTAKSHKVSLLLCMLVNDAHAMILSTAREELVDRGTPEVRSGDARARQHRIRRRPLRGRRPPQDVGQGEEEA